MTKAAEFLLDPASSGIYTMPADVAAFTRDAARCGFACSELDLSHASGKAQVLAAFRDALALPPTCSDNWDALADCLRDLSWHPAPGYALLLRGCEQLAQLKPDVYETTLEILDAVAIYWRGTAIPFFAVVDFPGNAVLMPVPHAGARCYKVPISVLVVVHTPTLEVLLLERADRPGFWQSVTGSREGDEALVDTARREVWEETGLVTSAETLRDWGRQNRFEIYAHWRARYAPGVTHNTEHVFSLELPRAMPVKLAVGEHTRSVWLPWREAADKVFSSSNAEAIRELPARTLK